MFDKLYKLKQNGYEPDIVFDIGAYHGHWTSDMLNIYNNAKYYLFEAIDYPELNRNHNNNNKIKKFNVVLNEKITDVDWYEMKNTGDSMFREKTYFFNNCNILKRQSIDLDTLSKKEDLINPEKDKKIFIKIDCQGAEIPILKGATGILQNTDFVLLEIPLFGQYNEGVPNFLEHVQYMDSIGFAAYDIVDNHYMNNFNMQVDFLFINKKHHFNVDVNNRIKYELKIQ
jgi:FkbM family methyltransferase